MKSLNNSINSHLTDINNQQLLNYENLPSMDLYMEQLMLFLDSALRQKKISSFDTILTPAMVNNYVKDGVINRPTGKRYQKEHMASLIEVSLLKDVLDIEQVKVLVQNQNEDIKANYNNFVEEYNKLKKQKINKLKKDLKDKEENNISQIYDVILELALNNSINDLLINHLFDLIKIYKDTN